jgi:transposase
VHCSNCGETQDINTLGLDNFFCPECGERNSLE